MIDFGQIFKTLIWDSLVSAALRQLFAAVPFLGWGPIGWLVSLIVTKVADYVYAAVDEFIDLKVIAFKKMELAREYSKVSLDLKNIALSKGIESDEFKAAREVGKKSLSALIKFNG